MDSTTTMTVTQAPSALSRVGIQDPSVLAGTRCVQGDLQVTTGQVRPDTGGSPQLDAARVRPVAAIGTEPAPVYVPFAGYVWPGGIRQT